MSIIAIILLASLGVAAMAISILCIGQEICDWLEDRRIRGSTSRCREREAGDREIVFTDPETGHSFSAVPCHDCGERPGGYPVELATGLVLLCGPCAVKPE